MSDRGDQLSAALDGRVAGFVTRLMAYLLDLVVLVALIALGGWLFVLVDDFIQSFFPEEVDLISLSVLFAALIPILMILYYVGFWSLTGRTPGKWVLGLRVVGSDGEPPRLGRSFIRLFGYVVSALAFWMGYLWVLVDNDRQAWHDHMARTWVVYAFELPRRGEDYERTKQRLEDT
jgi:uncharacterized RDD family membrane protein YckC